MKKTVYIILMAILAIVIVLTAVLLSRKGNDGDPDTSPNVSASASPSGLPSEEPGASPSESTSPTPSGEPFVVQEETAEGTILTIAAAKDLTCRLTIDETVLAYTGHLDGSFIFISPEDENEYIKISLISDAQANKLAPSFLDSYIKFTEFEQSGQEPIGAGELTGEKIAANDGITQVEAWLIDTNAGVLAVVLSYTIADQSSQLPQLETVLDTFEIKSENAEGWASVTMPPAAE